jgi:hypothetical protein
MRDFETRQSASPEERAAAESVVERVYLAVQHLCTEPGDVRKRLQVAIMTLLPLQVRNFPISLQQDFDWVIRESTKYKSPHPQFRGDLEATMMRIKNSTGQKIAQRIFNIYSSLQDIRGFPLLEFRAIDE